MIISEYQRDLKTLVRIAGQCGGSRKEKLTNERYREKLVKKMLPLRNQYIKSMNECK